MGENQTIFSDIQGKSLKIIESLHGSLWRSHNPCGEEYFLFSIAYQRCVLLLADRTTADIHDRNYYQISVKMPSS